MNNISKLMIESWACSEGNVNKTEDILKWINELNSNTKVKIEETSISDNTFWFYDDYNGEVLNRKRSFFSIIGMRYFVNDNLICEQPIIKQKEIGFLGIIVKEIDGVLNFLMQAKIEPGNVNCIQLSPTIQATKSNFIRAHGGRLPYYFDWFENAEKNGKVVYDQIQSEQGSRFDEKRNRNIILKIEEDTDIEVYPNYKWMTLGQIKALSKIDNLVNMDTRTVLAGLPLFLNSHTLYDKEKENFKKHFKDEYLFNSLFSKESSNDLVRALSLLNDYKMKNDVKKLPVSLKQLINWEVNEKGITCKEDADFEVRFYDIDIEGREVQNWSQPLFKAKKEGLFVLFTKVKDNERKYLISLKPEIGCFDKIEYGPTIQTFSKDTNDKSGIIEKKYFEKYINNKTLVNVLLSEEGGRFFHEQNRNIIVELDEKELETLPEGYLWVNYATLNHMCMFNNILNIQLRSLLSLIDL